MLSRFPLKLLWWLPLLLALAAHLAIAPAQGEQTAPACTPEPARIASHSGPQLSDILEILSWNIQKAGNKGWAEDLAILGDNVDLAFIQEASLHAPLAEVIPRDVHRAFAEGYSTATQRTGVMTLSASAPNSDCQLTAMEPWLRTPKATSVTTYPLRDKAEHLLAINLHAVNFDLGIVSFQSQFDALRVILEAHDGPVILAGDLNTWSESRQNTVDNFMQDFGLGAVAFEPDLRTRAFGRALDHIYVRGLSADHAEVIPVTSSDHNPLRVRLIVN